MNRKELGELKNGLLSLAVFRKLLSDGVIDALLGFLKAAGGEEPPRGVTGAVLNSLKVADRESEDTSTVISAYGEFVSRLYEANAGDLSSYVENLCCQSENVYVRRIGRGKEPDSFMTKAVEKELALLSRVAQLTPQELTESIAWQGFLPEFSSRSTDLVTEYRRRTEQIGKYGYGKYAGSRMFCVDGNGEIAAVRNSDPITLDSLVDYEKERAKVVENTRALLEGKPAANILLTGDAGTGKSSTIKAVGNAFYSEGLRIVEVRKDQLQIIPRLLDELADNPLKFILFIDDLSFLSDDDDFNALKAVLEGSVSVRSKNVVVYATSNRRHIIRERFSDRDGDDIHRNDAMQEVISLSNRFGLHITFQRPDKKTYLDIVRALAVRSGITRSDEELVLLAERFALERGGRSARMAQQFIDSLLSE